MKKTLLIAILPALLLSTGCSNQQSKKELRDIKEDTLAHENIFGEIKLTPQRLGDPSSDWKLTPIVGVQHVSYVAEDVTYYAVRYVAAINGLEEGVTASWTRAVSGKDASILKAQQGNHLSTVEYDTLNNGGTPIHATDEGSGYNKYIVYTIYDIPANQKDSFMMAYLTLTKAEEEVVSKAVATRLGGTYAFTFDVSTRGFFLGGDIQGDDVYLPNAEEDEHSYAIFQNMDLERDDYFGLFSYTGEEFKYYGYSSFYTNSTTHVLNKNEIIQPKYFGNYSIRVSKDEETRNQVLIIRNKLRLDAATTTYNESVWDAEQQRWTPEVVEINGRDDILFSLYGCDPSSGNLLLMGGPSKNSFIEINQDVSHLFNMKSVTVKYTTTASPCDNPLILKPEFTYVASTDNYIYGEDDTYRSLWDIHTFTGDSGTYSVEFDSHSIKYSSSQNRISAYPNFFRIYSYVSSAEGAVNAEFRIEYIEITFANELA